GAEWAALLGVLAVSASAPSVRWAALGALIAVATVLAKDKEHLAWIAFGVLGLTAVLQALATPAWSGRVQAAVLALGLVLMVLASSAALIRMIVLPATGFLVMLALGTATASSLVRFQWVAALGALLLVAQIVLAWLVDRGGRSAIVRDQLLFALLLLGMSARDALGLGLLAGALLLIDLAIVRVEAMPERWPGTAGRGAPGVPGLGRAGRVDRVRRCARPAAAHAQALIAGEIVRPIVLASTSPRRIDILTQAGVVFRAVAPEIEQRPPAR